MVLIALLAICVLTIDVGLTFVSYAQLQNAVDSAALAGASQLVGFVTQTQKDSARAEALKFAAANKVDRTYLHLRDSDIEFGCAKAATRQFVPEAQFQPGDFVNSIRVSGKRNLASIDGPVGLFFGPLFGMDFVQFNSVVAIGTQPRRYVAFVLDRSGSMCYDTTGITKYSSGQANYSMVKSPSGWYWMPKQYYYSSSWQTAYFWATDDTTGLPVTNFLPAQTQARLVSGQYFRFCSYDTPDTVASGWLYAPPNVTLFARYNTTNWSADAYGPVGSCDYATASSPPQPIQDCKDAANAFISLLSPTNDKAALVTFARDATLDYPLTSDFNAVANKINMFMPDGITATPNGMDLANDELIDSGHAVAYGHQIMLLLTDGNANALNGTSYGNQTETYTFLGQRVTCAIRQVVAARMDTETRRAKNGAVRIYTVSFGADADRVLAPLIAKETNGAFYYAVDRTSLTAIFTDIFRRLPPILTF